MDNEPNEEAEIFKSVIRALRANAREDADTIHNLREELCKICNDLYEARVELNRYKRQWEESRSENVEGTK